MEEKLKPVFDHTMKFGKMVHEFKDEDYGMYVVTGMQAGGGNTMFRRIGKVVQVRQESGAFGSDTIFLRHPDGILWTHENQCYYKIDDVHKKFMDDFYANPEGKEREFNDVFGDTYSIGGEQERTGFIIPSELPEGEISPLKKVRAEIIDLLFKNEKES